MMSKKEYVISLYDYNELDSFYQDMETPGGNLYIPDRVVPVYDRRPISRNTHYLLTDQEADTIRNDSRVLAVELSLSEQGADISPNWTQISSYWNKSNLISDLNVYPNWALLRCIDGAQIPNWGIDGTLNQSATVRTTSSGKGVDVVIVDGHMDPAHPEFSTTLDGTGPSRVVQFNWFSLTPIVNGGAPSAYVYTPYIDPAYPDTNGDGISDRTSDNNHGCQIAGIVAGNTQGWARDAAIYNISPYASSPSYVAHYTDYVRAWHNAKTADPSTGIKRPTITNHSYGIRISVDITTITTVVYRGVSNSGPFTANQLQSFGIYSTGGFASVITRNAALEVDLQDAITDGIIVVGAAGNVFTKISLPSPDPADDYNNYLIKDGTTLVYYNRGSITAAPNIITVGSISTTVLETKATSSNCGPRIDVYAPGEFITSSVNSSDGVTVTDKRNTSYYQTKISGTSGASPQVSGILACLAETWPTMKQSQALEYVIARAKTNQIVATSGGITDFTDLQGSANRYLYYFKERPENGQVYPKVNQGNRQATGMVYPRNKIYRYGR